MSNVGICNVRTIQRMAIAIVYAGCKLEVIASMSTHVAKQQQHQYAPHPAEAYGRTAEAAARPPSRPCASTPFRSSPVCPGLCGGFMDFFLLSPLPSLANMYPLRRYFFCFSASPPSLPRASFAASTCVCVPPRPIPLSVPPAPPSSPPRLCPPNPIPTFGPARSLSCALTARPCSPSRRPLLASVSGSLTDSPLPSRAPSSSFSNAPRIPRYRRPSSPCTSSLLPPPPLRLALG